MHQKHLKACLKQHIESSSSGTFGYDIVFTITSSPPVSNPHHHPPLPPIGGGGRPTQVLTQSHDMEELRPDLLPVSTAASTSCAPDSTTLATTHAAKGRGAGGGGGGAGTATVGSGLSVISSAVPSAAQTQQITRLPPPPSKGAVPVGGTPLPHLLACSHSNTCFVLPGPPCSRVPTAVLGKLPSVISRLLLAFK